MNENGKSNGQSNGRLSKDQWAKIEADFLKFEGTIGDFAINKELPFSTVYNHSRDGDWIKKREKARTAEMLSGKVEFDGKVSSTLDKVMELIGGSLVDDDGKPVGMNPKEISNTMAAVQRVVETRYRIMDIPLPKQRIENMPDDKSPSEELEDRVREQVNQIKPNSGE